MSEHKTNRDEMVRSISRMSEGQLARKVQKQNQKKNRRVRLREVCQEDVRGAAEKKIFHGKKSKLGSRQKRLRGIKITRLETSRRISVFSLQGIHRAHFFVEKYIKKSIKVILRYFVQFRRHIFCMFPIISFLKNQVQ